jgi:hypothetical protein
MPLCIQSEERNSKMPKIFTQHKQTIRIFLSCCFLSLLVACGNSTSSTAPTAPLNLSEAIVMTDQTKVQLATFNGSSTVVVDTALIPGMPGTYARSGNTVTVTMPNHGIRDQLWVDLQFAAGTGGTATSGNQKITVVNDDTFTFVDTASGTITGGTVLRKFINTLNGTYVQAGNVMTVTFANHELEDGDTVDLRFTSGTATNLNTEVDGTPGTNTFVVQTNVAATTTGNVSIMVGTNYIITDARMHPSGKWVYTSSQYDCYNGSPYCWGGDLISRFAIDWTNGKLNFEKSFRTYTSTRAAPVAFKFSADGTLMVSQDDDLDGLLLWSVDTTTGDLTIRAQSGSSTTGQHGIAFATSGNLIYHGSSVFGYSTSPYAISRTFTGVTANGTTVLGTRMFNVNTSNLRMYSLSTPTLPSLTAQISHSSTNEGRDLAVLNNGSLIVTSGFNGLASYAVGTSTISTASPTVGSSVLIDGNTTTWPTVDSRMYRSIDAESTGQYVMATYFTHGDPIDAGQGGVAPSGLIIARVSADGALTRVVDVPGYEYARVARFIRKP